MSRTRIVRVRQVGDYRVFQGWKDDGRADDFQRVNVIYGTNGSGKSTLASLFQECAAQTGAGAQANVQLAIANDDGDATVDGHSEGFWGRVRVFNALYVRENLRFDDAAGPRSDSLLTLGKAKVDAEVELVQAQDRIEVLTPQLSETRDRIRSIDKAHQQRLTEVAGRVVEDLRLSPVATYRGTNTYTRSKVRALLEGDRSVFDSASSDVTADRSLATSEAPAPYTSLDRTRLPDSRELAARSQELLRADVLSKPLAELDGHAPEAEWVQRGLDLHEARNNCLFCGGELHAERRAELAAHFDRSLTDLQDRIAKQLETLALARTLATTLVESIPRDGDLAPHLAGDLRIARSAVRAGVDDFQKCMDELATALREKLANPFQVSKLDQAVPDTPSIAPVLEVVAAHETLRQAHSTEASAAARRVELARVKPLIDEFEVAAKTLREQGEIERDLQSELTALNLRVVALQNVDADPVPQAAELTGNVARLLGRSDLAFTPSEDGKHYRIERSGLPATHLSEGERTAIALLHFLASVREGVVQGDEPIVVVDDPVSSMDDGILFGVSSFLWSALVERPYASQVILLTHNFELLRQWVTQLESAGKHVLGGYSIHELRMRYRKQGSGAARRMPQLDPWTSDRQKSRRLRSLYHFLFARVATSVLEATPELSLAERMDLLALAPNAARKMTEAFLSFRFPQYIGNFHGGMRAVISSLDDPTVKTHVERYLHAYSHNEEGNVSAMLDPGEATVVLRSLFGMIQAVDPTHFSAMCEALGIDEHTLLAVPA